MVLRRLIAFCGLFLLLTACGYKAPLKPLGIKRPKPVSAPDLRQQGEALLLSWQLPTSHQDGSGLEKLPVVNIYRMTYDPQDDCPECFDRSELLFSIEPDLPEPARKVTNRFLLLDRQVQAGIGYQYKLIVQSGADQTSQPVILRLAFAQSLPAPKQIEVIPHDRSVTLRWQPVPLAEGDSLLGYQVYRRTTEIRASYPINPNPLQDNSFEDFNLENGRSYNYLIRTLIKRGEQTIEGIASDELLAIPKSAL